MDIPTDVNAKVTMKIGLKIENIFPQIIMEWPGFVLHENAWSIVSQMDIQVIVIGPDMEGDNLLIGQAGYIVHSEEPCPTECALV